METIRKEILKRRGSFSVGLQHSITGGPFSLTDKGVCVTTSFLPDQNPTRLGPKHVRTKHNVVHKIKSIQAIIGMMARPQI
jgi:hypothetical protein